MNNVNLFSMNGLLHSILVVGIMSLVTIALRALPFIVFSGKTQTPKLIAYLGKVLPPAVMAMLVIYCLKDTAFTTVAGFIPQLVATAVVVLSYIWKKNSLISIVLGTAAFMIMIRII